MGHVVPISNAYPKLFNLKKQLKHQDHRHLKTTLEVAKGGVHNPTPPSLIWKCIIVVEGEQATFNISFQEPTNSPIPSGGYTKRWQQTIRMGHFYVSPNQSVMIQAIKNVGWHVSLRCGIILAQEAMIEVGRNVGFILDNRLLIFLIIVGEERCFQGEGQFGLQQWEIGHLGGNLKVCILVENCCRRFMLAPAQVASYVEYFLGGGQFRFHQIVRLSQLVILHWFRGLSVGARWCSFSVASGRGSFRDREINENKLGGTTTKWGTMEDGKHEECRLHHGLAKLRRRNCQSERHIREVREEVNVDIRGLEEWKEDEY